MRYERTTNPDTFARRLAELPNAARPMVRIEELDRRGRWFVAATVDCSVGVGRVELLLETHVGTRLGATVAAVDAWPTHSQALVQVREVVELIEAAARDAKLCCVVSLDVSRRVLAERPSGAAIPTASGRRLGAVIAWAKGRAAA